jgi:hypothetical protein
MISQHCAKVPVMNRPLVSTYELSGAAEALVEWSSRSSSGLVVRRYALGFSRASKEAVDAT